MSERVEGFTEMGGELVVRWDTATGAGHIFGGEAIGEDQIGLKAAFDAMQSLILGHACAGVDVTSAAYHEGLQTAVDAVLNEFD